MKNNKMNIKDKKELTDKIKKIDELPHVELCVLWRFGNEDEPLLHGLAGAYFRDRLFGHFGGFNPQISKQIGWG